MGKTAFKVTYHKKEIALEIASCKMELWKALYPGYIDEQIGLFIEVQAERKDIETAHEGEPEPYQHSIDPRIYTEWLEIPISSIKNKDFKTLESVAVNFSDSGEMDDIERLVFTEAPGALYIDKHGAFKKVKITIKYIGSGLFNVSLIGTTEFDTAFEVCANIPFTVELKAYDKRATKEDIESYFETIFDKNDFDYNWRYRDDDIFFTAKPKELEKSHSS